MKLPDEWINKADFLLVDSKRHLEEGVYWMACFEAQQATEIYLKATIVALLDYIHILMI